MFFLHILVSCNHTKFHAVLFCLFVILTGLNRFFLILLLIKFQQKNCFMIVWYQHLLVLIITSLISLHFFTLFIIFQKITLFINLNSSLQLFMKSLLNLDLFSTKIKSTVTFVTFLPIQTIYILILKIWWFFILTKIFHVFVIKFINSIV